MRTHMTRTGTENNGGESILARTEEHTQTSQGRAQRRMRTYGIGAEITNQIKGRRVMVLKRVDYGKKSNKHVSYNIGNIGYRAGSSSWYG